MRCPLQRSFPILLGSLLMGTLVHCQTEDAVHHNIRVIVEYIETSHALVTELMVSEHADSGPKLHARMRTLIKEKKARIMETSIVTTRSGQKATAESIMEYIYPSEYEPGGLGWTPPSLPVDASGQYIYEKPVRPTHPPTFETRNTGVTLEIEPIAAAKGRIIDLRIAPEIVDLLRLETWVEHEDQWGEAPMTMPTFGTFRVSVGTTLQDGKFGFIGILTPTKKDGGSDTTRKIMLFVRADVMTPGS